VLPFLFSFFWTASGLLLSLVGFAELLADGLVFLRCGFFSQHARDISLCWLHELIIVLLFILSQNDNDVVIIDQHEDDLDNQVVYTEFIKKLKEKKYETQFIFATHNANIPVLGDAERIVAADSSDGTMHISSGTIDSKETHQQIVDIMEGGYEAFKRRTVIY
jgi:hypothetical protein